MQQAGISACLVKPVRQSRLIDCLRDVLNASRSGSSADPSEVAPPDATHGPAATRYVRVLVAEDKVVNQRVVMRHALRNALIAPFTVIVLQMNWLLSGVVVVEVFFEYDGFGKLLLEAALFGDVYVVQACTLVAVIVAVTSQIISDVGYTFLNPRIRFA